MTGKKLIVATRPSILATTQTEQTVSMLKKANPDIDFEIVRISTQGDRNTDKPLLSFGGTGVFVKELENALISGRADIAVHSLKDVPAFTPASLLLASFPKREDPRDVMLLNNNPASPADTKNQKIIIGTGSPRRIVQLTQLFPNAVFHDLRGNIDTRLRKLSEGQYDAIIIAAAGLRRLGKEIPQNAFLEVNVCIPAVSQGIIGIECRKDDAETINIIRKINDSDTEIAVMAERGFMIQMEGNCKFPLAAHAIVEHGIVKMSVMLGNPQIREIIKHTDSSPVENAAHLGFKIANFIKPIAIKSGILSN